MSMRIKVDIGPFRRYIRKKLPEVHKLRQRCLELLGSILASVMRRYIFFNVSTASRQRAKPHIWESVDYKVNIARSYVRIGPDEEQHPYALFLDIGFDRSAGRYIPYFAWWRLYGTEIPYRWLGGGEFGVPPARYYKGPTGRIMAEYSALINWADMILNNPELYGRGGRVQYGTTRGFPGIWFYDYTVSWYKQNWRQLHRYINQILLREWIGLG